MYLMAAYMAIRGIFSDYLDTNAYVIGYARNSTAMGIHFVDENRARDNDVMSEPYCLVALKPDI
jgi:hypothetical protein